MGEDGVCRSFALSTDQAKGAAGAERSHVTLGCASGEEVGGMPKAVGLVLRSVLL